MELCNVDGIVCSKQAFSPVIRTVTLQGKYCYYPHLTDGETESQKASPSSELGSGGMGVRTQACLPSPPLLNSSFTCLSVAALSAA